MNVEVCGLSGRTLGTVRPVDVAVCLGGRRGEEGVLLSVGILVVREDGMSGSFGAATLHEGGNLGYPGWRHDGGEIYG